MQCTPVVAGSGAGERNLPSFALDDSLSVGPRIERERAVYGHRVDTPSPIDPITVDPVTAQMPRVMCGWFPYFTY